MDHFHLFRKTKPLTRGTA